MAKSWRHEDHDEHGHEGTFDCPECGFELVEGGQEECPECGHVLDENKPQEVE